MISKLTSASLAVALLLSACATNTEKDDPRATQANAMVNTTALQTTPETGAQLAVEVEITAGGITPISASIVRAAPKSNSAIADLRVEATGEDNYAYTMPDPRIAEVDAEGLRILPSMRWFVYVPLSPAVTDVVITPFADDPKRPISRGGSIDLRPLMVAACRQSELPVCREIVAKFGRKQ